MNETTVAARTRDLDEAEEIVRKVYVEHRLVSACAERLSFELESSTSPRITIGRLRYGADVELVVPPMASAYHMNLPVRGTFRGAQGSTEVVSRPHGNGVIFDPRAPHVAAWADDAILYAVKVGCDALQTHARAILGRGLDGPIEFPLGFDLSSASGQSLISAVRFLRKEIGRAGGIADSVILRAQLEEFVMTQLLMAVPNSLQDALVRPVRRPNRRHVARVVDYIHAHPHLPLTLAELASIGAVGARALQEGFHEEFGTSPTAYLRGVRLDHAHAELQEAEPGDSVTQIASRWGFGHMSRFSEQYKRRFGVSPSTTLRQSAGRTSS